MTGGDAAGLYPSTLQAEARGRKLATLTLCSPSILFILLPEFEPSALLYSVKLYLIHLFALILRQNPAV